MSEFAGTSWQVGYHAHPRRNNEHMHYLQVDDLEAFVQDVGKEVLLKLLNRALHVDSGATYLDVLRAEQSPNSIATRHVMVEQALRRRFAHWLSQDSHRG